MTAGELLRRFTEVFGNDVEPMDRRLFFAPGRVNLIGEHTDYNGGHVLPCALTLGTYALAAPRRDGLCRFYSTSLPEDGVVEFPLSSPWEPEPNGWSRYPRGVLSVLHGRGKKPLTGLDILFHGTIPAGAGLSSSASIEVATGFAFLAVSGLDVDLVELAKMSREAENDRVGVKCGIMDQFAAAASIRGRAILLNCDSLEYRHCELSLPGSRLVITNSNKPHALASSGYNERFRECGAALSALKRRLQITALCQIDEAALNENADLIDDDLLLRRARFVVGENQRALRAAERLEKGDLSGFGALMNESHVSMRDDFEISCRELDVLVELAWSIDGVHGSRMTGGGFGGCSISLVKQDAVEEFKAKVGEGYMASIGYPPTFYLPETSDGVSEIKMVNPGAGLFGQAAKMSKGE